MDTSLESVLPTLDPQPNAPRTFLFLQGLASPFFAELGRELIARGHRVRRINISLGDQLFWRLPAINYRGSLANWRAFVSDLMTREAVTDIVLFGDCRPYHRIAIHIAGYRGIRVHVCEEGYLRPNWMTVEQGGVNGHSSLPRRRDAILSAVRDLAPETKERDFPGSFARRAFWDVSYNVANIVGRPLYIGYRRHRPNHVLVEYAGWLKRLVTRKRTNAHAEAEAERAFAAPAGFYLVPLQLDSDYQIRVHSQYGVLGEFLDEVCHSFSHHAPAGTELLVKVHPLDNGLIDRRRQVMAIAARHGIADRVRCIDGGYLPTLLVNTLGVVVVNSTVGLTAIEVGRPTVALGTSIYNIPGLAHQGSLDAFWSELTPPDMELVRAFRRLVIHRTQINGSYFDTDGIANAAREAADRVTVPAPVTPAGRVAQLDPAPPFRRPLAAE